MVIVNLEFSFSPSLLCLSALLLFLTFSNVTFLHGAFFLSDNFDFHGGSGGVNNIHNFDIETVYKIIDRHCRYTAGPCTHAWLPDLSYGGHSWLDT